MTRRSPNTRKRSPRQAAQTSPPLSDFGRAVEAATALAEVGRELVGTLDPGRVTYLIVDAVMRQIPDHFHAHARDPHWWSRRFGGARRPGL